MANLNLTDKEREYLMELLARELSDLRMEIADTDNMKFKQMLRENKALLEGVIGKLKQASAAVLA